MMPNAAAGSFLLGELSHAVSFLVVSHTTCIKGTIPSSGTYSSPAIQAPMLPILPPACTHACKRPILLS